MGKDFTPEQKGKNRTTFCENDLLDWRRKADMKKVRRAKVLSFVARRNSLNDLGIVRSLP